MKLILFVSAAAASAAPLQLKLLPNDVVEVYGARCMDGSPYGYYVRTVSGSKDWVFMMQGGGLCVHPQDCMNRAQSELGSSINFAQTYSDDSNVLNDDPKANPFAGFNAVYLPYCSGDTHLGKSKEKNWLMGGVYTSGHLNVEATLDHLYDTTSMGSGVDRVLLAGSSAGGIGALHHADWMTDTITQKFGFQNAIVKASPQAGLFFPVQPESGLCVFGEFKLLGENCPRADDLMSSFVERIAEGGAYAAENCMKATENHHSCWDVGIAARYVRTPLFFAQNRYDEQQMVHEMLCDECTADASAVTEKGRSYMKYYGEHTETVLHDLADNFGHSVFMPNCYDHVQSLCMKSGPEIGGQSYSTSLSDWFFNDAHHAHFDDCGDFPCSEVCTCSSLDLVV